MPDNRGTLPGRLTVRIDNPHGYVAGASPQPVPVDLSRAVRDDPDRPGAVLNAGLWRVEGGKVFEIHPRHARQGDYMLTASEQLQAVTRAEPVGDAWLFHLNTARAYRFADLQASAKDDL